MVKSPSSLSINIVGRNLSQTIIIFDLYLKNLILHKD